MRAFLRLFLVLALLGCQPRRSEPLRSARLVWRDSETVPVATTSAGLAKYIGLMLSRRFGEKDSMLASGRIFEVPAGTPVAVRYCNESFCELVLNGQPAFVKPEWLE